MTQAAADNGIVDNERADAATNAGAGADPGMRPTSAAGSAAAAGWRSVPPEKRFVARVLHAWNRAFTHAYHRVEVFSPCKLPKTGPAILVCNHTSGLDPHLLQSPCRRLITWMMAQDYYDQRYLKAVFDQLGVIPVTRSGRDTTATRAALRALQRGQLVGIFPEGRIETSREMMPFQVGVALLALKSGVPVYPAFLDGTQRNKKMLTALLTPQRARVIFGDEVQFDRGNTTREGLSDATDAIYDAVAALRDRMDMLVASRAS